jgi:hypothetical protein
MELGPRSPNLENKNWGSVQPSFNHHNAENWDDEKSFINYRDIRGKWFGDLQEKFLWRGGGGPSVYNRPEQNPEQWQNSSTLPPQKKCTGGAPSYPGNFLGTLCKGPFGANHLCRRFQFKKCTQQDEKECTSPWGHGKLVHQCSFYNRDKRKFCEQNHPFFDQK